MDIPTKTKRNSGDTYRFLFSVCVCVCTVEAQKCQLSQLTQSSLHEELNQI